MERAAARNFAIHQHPWRGADTCSDQLVGGRGGGNTLTLMGVLAFFLSFFLSFFPSDKRGVAHTQWQPSASEAYAERP